MSVPTYTAAFHLEIVNGNQWAVTDGTTTDTLANGTNSVVIGTTTFLLVDQFGAGVGGYQAVQAAVSAATGGETVIIAGGNYTENVSITANDLTVENLSGSAVSITGTGGFGAAISIGPNVTGVTIQSSDSDPSHFVLTGAPGGELAALYLVGNNDNTHVSYITVTAAPTGAGGGHNAVLTGDGLDHVTFDHNVFSGPSAQLVYVNGAESLGAENTDVNFTNNTFSGSATGPLLGIEASSGTISGNTFSGASETALGLAEGGMVVTGNIFNGDQTGEYFGGPDNPGGYDAATILTTNTFSNGDVYIQGKAGVYATIQEAIDAASNGDTIIVSAGTYNENLNIDKGVIIEGANAGIGGNDTRGPETIITGQSQITTTAQVVLDGLEFLDNQPYSLTINDHFVALTVLTQSVDGHVIENSIFDHTPASNPVGFQDNHFVGSGAQPTHRGIEIASVGSGTQITIQDNLFTGVDPYPYAGNDWRSAIYSNGGNGATTITNNTFENVRSAINADSFSSNVHITNNSFDHAGSGVSVGVGSDVANVTSIADNTFGAHVDNEFNFGNLGTAVTFDAGATGNVLSNAAAADPTEALYVEGGSAGDHLTGTDQADILLGDGGNDTLHGGAGNDFIDGGAGTDTAHYDGTLTASNITPVADIDPNTAGNQAGWQVDATPGSEGTDTLTNTEVVQDLAPPAATGRFLLVGNGGFATIQAAIDAANDGDTILIAAGTYNENVNVNVAGVTLEGVGAVTIQGSFKSDNGIADGGVAAFLQTAASYSGASGTGITIAADGVSLSNLNIDGFVYGLKFADGMTVDSTSIDQVDVTDSVIGLEKGTTTGVTHLAVTDGSVSDGYIGVNFGQDVTVGHADQGKATDITFDGTSFTNLDAKGIYVETLSHAHLTNITMDDVGQYGAGLAFGGPTVQGTGGDGIDLNLKNGTYSNIEIDNFQLTDTGESDKGNSTINPIGDAHGGAIVVEARDAGSYVNVPAHVSDAISIHDGTIDGHTSTGIQAGESGQTNPDGPAVNISNVTISGAEQNAKHGDIANVTTDTMTVALNPGQTLSISPTSTGPIVFIGAPGTDNTFTGGPGDNDAVNYPTTNLTTSDFSFDPNTGKWTITTGGETDTLTGIEKVTDGSGHTFLLVDPSGSFTTIQAAVDAASSGDTILLGSGTYTEQVTIDPTHGHGADGITIEAAPGATVTVKAPNASLTHFADDPVNGKNINAVVGVTNADNVTIRGIEVDGDHQAAHITGPGSLDFVGIAYINTDGGDVDGVTVTNIEDNPFNGVQRGQGILVTNTVAGPAPTNTFTVENSTIEHFQKTGILARNTIITIDNDQVHGEGATGQIAQNGIQLSSNSTGSVTNNTIDGIGYTPGTVSPAGMLVFGGTGLQVTGNTYNGTGATDLGFYFQDTSNATVEGNHINNASLGIEETGTIAADNDINNQGPGANDFSGDATNYLYDPSNGSVSPMTVEGTDGPDTFVLTTSTENIQAGTGDDTFVAGAPADLTGDTLNGGGDHDAILFTSTTNGDTLVVGSTVTNVEGVDIGKLDTNGNFVTTNTAATNVDASAAPNGLDIEGSSGDNNITGTAFADTIDGKGGTDTLTGGDGSDIYYAGSNDTVIEQPHQGTDEVRTLDSLVLPANVENLTLLDGDANTQTFDNMPLGPITNGENGWRIDTDPNLRDESIVDGPNGTHEFKMSSDPAVADFAGPYSPELGLAAGEPDTGAEVSNQSISFNFQAVNPSPDGSRLEVDLGNAAGTDRNNFLVIESYPGVGIRIAVSEPDINGNFSGDGVDLAPNDWRELICGVDPTVAHTLEMRVDYIDGPNNDVVQIYLDGHQIGTSTTFENYHDAVNGVTDLAGHIAQATANLTDRVFFRPSANGAAQDGHGGDNAGFYFDNVTTAVYNNTGGTGNDEANVITGNSGDNTLTGLGGNDSLIGNAGIDTAVYQDAASNYTVTETRDAHGFVNGFTQIQETGANTGAVDEGVDTLSGIEKITFQNGTPSTADDVTFDLAQKVQLFDSTGHLLGTFDHIQDAIAAATAGSGDTVMVRNGTYAENITLKNGVNVVGESESGVVINGTMSTPASFDNTTVSNLTVKDFSSTAMLLDMRATTEVTDSKFDHVTFSLESDSTAAILIGNGQVSGSMALNDADHDGAGLTFSNVTMNSNNHDFAGSTAFAYTLFHSVDDAQMVLDHVHLNGTASGTDSGLGAQWNMSPNSGEDANVTIKDATTSHGGNFYVSGMESATITDNTFDGQGLALNGVTSATVTNNTFEHISTNFWANEPNFGPTNQHRGLTIENAWGAAGDSNITITGNTFDDITAADGAIAFQRWTDSNGNLIPATIDTLNDVDIEGNTFTNPVATPIYLNSGSFGTGAVLPASISQSQLIIGTSDSDHIVDDSTGPMAIFADAGDDNITGGSSDDLIYAGSGDDTVVYSGNVSDYVFFTSPDTSLQVIDIRTGSPEGTDTVYDAEHFQFADGTFSPGYVTDHAPTAVADTNSTDEDATLAVLAAETKNVLHNDHDPDTSDVLLVGAVNGDQANVGQAVTGVYGTLTLNADGSYTYVANTVQAEALGDGQTANDVFFYTVTDGQKTSDTTLTITVTGIDDPLIANSDTATVTEDTNVAVTGNVLTNDEDDQIDLDNVASVNGVTGDVGHDVTGTYGTLHLNSDGSYAYALNDSLATVQALAQDQTVTDTFTYEVTDHHGHSSSSTLTVTVSGTDDAPVLDADTSGPHSITERAGKTGDTTDLDTTSGSMTFTDVDLTDTHTADVSTPTLTWSGGTLTNSQETDLLAAGTLDLTLNDSTGTGTGSIEATYSAPDIAFDFLAAGETLTVEGDLTVSDGLASSTQTITLTITGTNDGPALSADASGPHSITERTGRTDDSGDLDSTTTGTMFFTDVDLNDTHTPSHDNGTFTWSDGALTVAQQAALQAASTLDLTLNDSIDTGAGSVDFTYSAADSTFDFLAAGETLTASYQVTVTDDQSASSTETVTITITGSNDAPTAADDSNAVTANVNSASQPNPVSGNVLGNDSDPDTTDTLAVSAVDGSGANVGTGVTGTYGTLTLNGDGSYTYALANGQANVQALSAGEVVTDTFQYTASDGNGGTSTATLTISVTGSNVLPTITSFDDDTGVQGDSITADTTITLHGTSDAGTQTVTVFDGTTELGFATVAADGSWTFTTQTLEDALHSFTVTATDAASNVTAPSFPFLVTVSADAPNTGPTVTANPLNMVQDDVTLIQAAAGISAADADGNAVTQFQLFDDNSARGTDDNNLSPDTTGYFLINGVAQKAGVNIDVGPADLPNVQFVAGATSDILWIRATDGQTFGAWVSFTVTETPHGKPLVNQAPVVTAHNQAATHNQVFTAAQLILSVADPNGDTITKYQFFDDHDARGTADNNPLHDNSGYFLLNGQREPEGVSIEITADQFNHDALTYQSAVDTDILWARAYDGNLWSAWTSFQITADDHKPVIGVISDLTVDKNVTLAEADLGIPTPTDADGDPIAQYQFWDGNDATGSGYFVLDGVDQAARQNVTVDAADLTHLTFQTDNVGTDTLWVRASDGVAWSDWVSFDVTATNTAPVVTGHNVPPLATNSDTVAVSSLFTVADANSDTITKYQLWDDNGARGTGDDHSSPDNTGHFVVNGVAETAGHAIDVSAAEIANSVFANGTVGSTEILWERAFDGTDWSNWTSVSITETHNAAVPGNEAPTVAVGDITVTTSAETFNASQLVTATDADNDAITAYQFFDDHQLPGTAENNPTNDISGHFVLNGEALTEGQHIEITADQFNANALTFQSGSGDDLLWVRAFDGQDWGAWASFHVDAPTNTAPAITTPTSLSVAANDSFAAGDLVTHVTDPDLGAHVAQYEFWDSTQTATSGHFEVNGAAQGSNAAIDVVAADLDHASFVAGSQPGTDQVWVRVNDGIEWSAWHSLTVTTT